MRTHDVSRTRRTRGKLMDRPDPSPAIETSWQPPDWMNDGECLELAYDPEWWFQPANSPDTRKAQRLCTLCPVRMQCLQYALDKGIKDGTWGGLSEKELRQIQDTRHAPGRKHHRGYDIGYRDGKR